LVRLGYLKKMNANYPDIYAGSSVKLGQKMDCGLATWFTWESKLMTKVEPIFGAFQRGKEKERMRTPTLTLMKTAIPFATPGVVVSHLTGGQRSNMSLHTHAFSVVKYSVMRT
jgi:hypothetical protein